MARLMQLIREAEAMAEQFRKQRLPIDAAAATIRLQALRDAKKALAP